MQTMDVEQEPMMVDMMQMQPGELSEKAEGKKPSNVIVDAAHPFELDSYIAGYSGQTEIQRLLYVVERCPALADAAFKHAVRRIKSRRNVVIYQRAVELYNSLPETASKAEVDAAWVDAVNAKNTSERNKLEAELKTYQSNMIKESIRMAHRDLGNFYRMVGDDNMALKHFTKSREFCTSNQQVLEMCLSVLELLIEQGSYAHLSTYVFKADSTLDLAAANASASGSTGTGSAALLHKKGTASEERAKVQMKLDVATALSHLGQSNYEKAALSFLKVGPPKGLEDWDGQIITASDIAIYGTLCALATLSRGAIEAQILKGEHFTAYLEQEPYVRELVNAYMSSKFKTVLEILEKYSARHYLDIHLSVHVLNLTNLIRDRALVLYFKPFATVKLQKMSAAFGIDMEELERLVVGLIQSGSIKGRVDSHNKILKANVTDDRAALFARASQATAQIQSTNRKLLLRMRLQQADLIVKPAEKMKSQQQQQHQQQASTFTTLGGQSTFAFEPFGQYNANEV